MTLVVLIVFCLVLLATVLLGRKSLQEEQQLYHAKRFADAMAQKRALYAAALALAAFVALVVFKTPVYLAFILGAMAWGGYCLLFGFEPANQKIGRMIGGKPEREILAEIHDSAVALDALREANAQLPDPVITRALTSIEDKTETILNTIVDQPEKFRIVRSFLSRHLSRMAENATGFIALSPHQREELTPKFKDGLEALDRALDNEQQALTSGEALDIDVSLAVLERTLRQ